MGADRTDSVLGMWKWPAVAGMFALQLYILCNPPAWLGGVVLPIVVGLSTASEVRCAGCGPIVFSGSVW